MRAPDALTVQSTLSREADCVFCTINIGFFVLRENLRGVDDCYRHSIAHRSPIA